MIFDGLATGERSLTFESCFFFALGASFFAAASTRLKLRMRGSPCASGQRCCGIASSALLTSSTASPCTIPRRSLSKRQSFMLFLESRVVDFAAEGSEPPARGLRVEAEADMARKGVCVAEDALQRVGLVDAVGAGHRVQRVYRLGGEAHRVGEIALEAELRGDVGDLPAAGDLLRLEAVGAQDQARGVDLRPRRADAQLHRLEVAHLRA